MSFDYCQRLWVTSRFCGNMLSDCLILLQTLLLHVGPRLRKDRASPTVSGHCRGFPVLSQLLRLRARASAGTRSLPRIQVIFLQNSEYAKYIIPYFSWSVAV